MSVMSLGRDSVPGRVVRVVEIPRVTGRDSSAARSGLRAIDLEGQQVGDFVCFNRDDLGERYSPQNTVLFNRTIYPKVGAALVSDRGRPMMRLVADTVGVHDLICGILQRGVLPEPAGLHGPSPKLLLEPGRGARPVGRPAPADVPFSFNFFMQWPVQPDGSVRPMAAPSRAGDYVDLVAEMDVLAANSACPSDITPTNADRPTPMRFVLYEPDLGAAGASR